MTNPEKNNHPNKRQLLAARALSYARRQLKVHFGSKVYSVRNFSNRRFFRLLKCPEGSGQNLSGDRDALSLVLRHYKERVRNDWPAVPRSLTDLRINLADMSDAQVIERADRALTGDIHPSGIRAVIRNDGCIDWSDNPSGNREWLLMLHRHAWWALWAEAYQRTSEEVYAEAFVSQLTDWIERHPLPKQRSEQHEPWRLMETGLRMRISWIPAFACFFESPAFTNSAKLKMLRSIYDHGQFLNRFHTNRNHLVRESNGLISLALCFPEFKEAKIWLTNGLRRLDEELEAQVNADGSHIEMSVGYQWLTIDEFEVTSNLLREHGKRLPKSDLNDALRRMYTYLAAVIRPDRTFPQLNDGFILWDASRLSRAGSASGWGDIEFIGSGGTQGVVPDFCSRSFPNAGIHIMRSDWSGDALYLIADTGPYGGPHGHEDKLSFELFAFGTPFVVDPGSYTYERSDPYRNYFVGSQGHNTVLVDGKSQVRRWSNKHLTPAVCDVEYGDWFSNEVCDFASAQYDEGYAYFSLTKPEEQRPDRDVTHRRDIIFAKPDYWIVVDYLQASGTHEFEFLFHLAPSIVVDEVSAASVILRSKENGARLILRALAEREFKTTVVTGEDAPIQGWYSDDHHKKCPSPTLVFQTRGRSSTCVPWLLYPLPNGSNPAEVHTEYFDTTEDKSYTFIVARNGKRDSFSIDGICASRDSGKVRLRASVVYNRHDGATWMTDSCGG